MVGLIGVVLSLVVLTGVARAGSTYLYCRMAQTIGEAPCCNHGASHEEQPTLSNLGMHCCERHVVPLLPTADVTSDAPAVADARPVHAIPMLALTTLAPEPHDSVLATALARAGPRRPPLYASEVRSHLMVFLR